MTVRVIDLRRAQTSGTMREGDARRVYSCRWVVSGHTRMQPYGPNRSLRRRIYIEPHLQGAEGAPLKTPVETMHLLDTGPRRR